MNNSKPTFDDIQCILFDLDDTLYPQRNGLWEMIGERINCFMIDQMHFSPEVVPELRHRLWEQYGTTLRGLQVEFTVDMDAFLAFVHDVPVEDILKPDPSLDQLFTLIPQRKVFFTNAHTAHARRVAKRLGVDHHFDTIVDIYTLAPFCKPQREAFIKTLELLEEEPQNCLLVDDNPKNLTTAHAFGLRTISVGAHHHDGSPHISTIHELGNFLIG